MKLKNLIIAAGLALAALTVRADLYETQAASGTTSATVYFAADVMGQEMECCYVDATSDLTSSVLTWQRGLASYQFLSAITNAAWTNLVVSATNGLAAGTNVLVQPQWGIVTNAVVSSITGTNPFTINLDRQIQFTVLNTNSACLWTMGYQRTTPVGNTTLRIYNEVLFHAPRGYPAQLSVNGTSTAKLNQVAIYKGTR